MNNENILNIIYLFFNTRKKNEIYKIFIGFD